MLNSYETYGLVNASAAAAGTAVVPRSFDGYRHLFLVTLSAACTVTIEAAVTAIAPGVLRWVPISNEIQVTDSIAIEGNFMNLRVSWTGNAGTITVDLIQSALNPTVY